MRRREFLGLGASAGLALAQAPDPDVAISSATQDTTPRVGIVLSSFREGADHDGTPITGLDDPQPPDADLTSAQLDAMVRKAIELAATRAGDFASTVGPEDWVVIKTHIPSGQGLTPGASNRGAHLPYVPGSVTDPRIVRSVISYLVEQKCGFRFTIVEGSGEWLPTDKSGPPVDGWTSKWNGAFDGLSYRSMIDDFSRHHPGIRFEILDLNFAPLIELPVPGGALASNNPDGSYTIPRIVQQCDKLITIAPLQTDSASGVSLTVGSYLGIAPAAAYGFPKVDLLKLGSPDEIMVDLFSYHPADLAIAGGCWGVEADGAASVHHNIVVAGARAICVDTVAATVMGFEPAGLPYLSLGERKGFGTSEILGIWTRGNEIDEALRAFRKPSRWRPFAGGEEARHTSSSRRSPVS